MNPQVNVYAADAFRNDLERALATLAAAKGLTVQQLKNDYNITPFVCMMAAVLNTTTSVYSLHPRNGVDPTVPGTTLLDQNDAFIFNQIGLRFGRAAYASNTYSNHGMYPKLTYPDPNYFTGNGTTAGNEANQLQEIVNGTLTLNVQGTSVIDKLICQDLVFNPQATYSSSPVAFPQFGGSDGERGYLHTAPTLILDAMADNEFQIALAPGVKGNIDGNTSTGTTDSGVRNILYVLCAGWKVKNFANGGEKIACS